MENILYWTLGLYFIPMVINILFVYFNNDLVYTVGDLLKYWGVYLIPFINLLLCLFVPIYYIDGWIKFEKRWEKFKNIKIR